jgi:twitching motility protein PilT
MIDLINQTRPCHIMTIEDPIEYVHTHKRAMVNQREVHTDTECFHNALRAVLREDPDVILIGEMRDLETIQAALTLAETGHLVFATLHTRNAPQTIDRIIDVFPPHQQEQIRVLLANTIEAVFAQQLIPMVGGGRVAAIEVMLANAAIRNLIREGKTHQIYSIMETQSGQGMITMDRALADLHRNGYITYEEAVNRAMDKENFVQLLKSA